MKKICVFLSLIVLSFNQSFAQNKTEEDAVKATINLLFDGMRNSDTTMIRKAFAAKNIMETIAFNKDGKATVRTDNINNFIKSIGAPHPEKYDERIVFNKILIDANLASVWTDYKFYVGENHQEQSSAENNKTALDSSISAKKQTDIQWKFSHCGVNSFQLFKGEDGWKIIYIIDTRRKENCN